MGPFSKILLGYCGQYIKRIWSRTSLIVYSINSKQAEFDKNIIFPLRSLLHISYFQDLGTLYVFIGYFFKGNPNLRVSRVTKVILGVQVNNKNGNPRDQDRE